MGKFTRCASLLAALILVSTVCADENFGDVKLPINPYQTAQVGDWATYVDKKLNTTETRTVKSIDGDAVRVDCVHPDGAYELNFSQKGELSLHDLLPVSNKASFEASDVTTTNETITVSGRTFHCKKVSFVWNSKKKAPLESIFEIWLTTEVKGGGFARITCRMQLKKNCIIQGEENEWKEPKQIMDFEVAGFGNGDKAEWGETSDGLTKRLAEAARDAKK
jgi:hypothetical protein